MKDKPLTKSREIFIQSNFVDKVLDKSHENDGVVNSAMINCHTCRRIFPHLIADIFQDLEIAKLCFLPYDIKIRGKNGK
jgi:hypothetical protein